MKSPEAVASDLAANGAVLHLLSSRAERYLVGELTWLDRGRLFWFTAHGDRREDGHVLNFDRATVIGPHAIEFVRGGRLIAHLTSITFADVDDVQDYAVAFSLWRQTATTCRTMIDQAREFALANSEPAAPLADSAILEPDLEAVSRSSAAQPSMSTIEMDALLAEVGRGVVTVKTAISLLALNGVDREDAARRIFHALGGCDQTEIGPDGRARYVGTGKLVCEVERKIAAGGEIMPVA